MEPKPLQSERSPVPGPATYRLPADPDKLGASDVAKRRRKAQSFEEADNELIPEENKRRQRRPPDDVMSSEPEQCLDPTQGPLAPASQKERDQIILFLSNIRQDMAGSFSHRIDAVNTITDILQDSEVAESTLLEDVVAAVFGGVAAGLGGIVTSMLVKSTISPVAKSVIDAVRGATIAPTATLVGSALKNGGDKPTPGALQATLAGALDSQRNDWLNDWDARQTAAIDDPRSGDVAELHAVARAAAAVRTRSYSAQLGATLGEWARAREAKAEPSGPGTIPRLGPRDTTGVLHLDVSLTEGDLKLSQFSAKFEGLPDAAVRAAAEKGVTFSDMMSEHHGMTAEVHLDWMRSSYRFVAGARDTPTRVGRELSPMLDQKVLERFGSRRPEEVVTGIMRAIEMRALSSVPTSGDQ